jgi:hypothetical protein
MSNYFGDPARMVRELRGAPLSIVVLLMATRQAMSNQALVGGTGYSDKTVSSGLAYLEQIGLVVRSSGGWRLTEGQQLPLTMGDEQLDVDKTVDNPEVEEVEAENFRLPIVVKPVVVVESELTLSESITTTDFKRPESEKFRLQANLEAFREGGVDVNGFTRRLAAMEHVNPEYIRGHLAAAKAAGCRVGLALRRIERGDVVEVERGEDRGRYAEWDNGW